MRYIGIDPGLKGAIVALSKDGELLWWKRVPLIDASAKRKEIDPITIYAAIDTKDRVTLERAQSMKRRGRVNTPRSMFTYGTGYGMIRAAIAIRCAPLQLVLPTAWQKVMLAGMDREDTKSAAIKKALMLWPDLRQVLQTKANHDVADAALIAEFGRRLWCGQE